jgi:hypothetical protein
MDFSERLRYMAVYVPIAHVSVFPGRCAVVRRVRSRQLIKDHVRGDRKMIKELTAKSRKLLAFTVTATSSEFDSILTLTYGRDYPVDGKVVKKHLNAFLTWLRRYGCQSYAWFLEFQKRGAPHIHILTDIPEVMLRDRINMAYAWLTAQGFDLSGVVASRILPNGQKVYGSTPWRQQDIDNMLKVAIHPRSWENVRSPAGAKHYCLKYAMKPYQKQVPPIYQNVGRFWGVSQKVRDNIKPLEEWDLNEETLRDLLKTAGSWYAEKPFIPKYLVGDFDVAKLDVNRDVT